MEISGTVDNYELPLWLSNFIEIYQRLSTDNLALLNDIYSPDVIFVDPIHHIAGFDNLAAYFADLYTNLSSCSFNVDEVIHNEQEAAIYWTMQYCHPKLNKGNVVSVHGHSKLRGKDGKVIYHRDYLDLGAMIYEHVPVLGKIIKHIKKRVNA
jgi:ketosteroid isomerase-like protein